MKMEQIVARLPAEMNAMQERMEANLDSTQEELRPNQERLEAKMDSNREEMKTQPSHHGQYLKEMKEEMMAKMANEIRTNQEIMADLKTQIGCLASRINVNQKSWMPG
jgi:chromosome segregation ATPase